MATKQKVDTTNAWHPSGARRKARAAHYSLEGDRWTTEAKRIVATLGGGDLTTAQSNCEAGREIGFSIPLYPAAIIKLYSADWPSLWTVLTA